MEVLTFICIIFFIDVETEHIQPNWDLREQFKGADIKTLQKKVQEINPNLYSQLNESERSNPQRLIRKIEISMEKKDFTQESLQQNITLADKLQTEIDIEYIGLRYKDKDAELHSIQKRVDKRMREGAVEEVEKLLEMGFTENDPGMKTIGYQQMMKYLKGDCSKDEMLQTWITKEIQYAKRQFTFMKRDKNITWREV